MKLILVIAVLCANTAFAQNVLQFNKRFVECEDRWVAFQKGKDSTYAYGFIYIDAQAGLTLEYGGSFTIDDAGLFVPKKLENSSYKIRLKPNNVQVALIPENKFEELKITAVPDWLRIYKGDTTSVERLYRWGYMYNGWNECAKGLGYLERAQKINPKYKGLEVELAFSYNCLGQYDKAVTVLQAALKDSPADAYVNKELIFAQINLGQLDRAAESCKKALAQCTDQSYNAENCYNLLHNLYLKKDKINFMLWLDETKKWTAKNENLVKSIQIMEDEMKKL